MYLPRQFQIDNLSLALDIMRQNPFASLISTDDSGLPFITHLPIHCQAPLTDGDPLHLVLLGHVARGNPHWKYLQSRPTAVVTFLGPHAAARICKRQRKRTTVGQVDGPPVHPTNLTHLLDESQES